MTSIVIFLAELESGDCREFFYENLVEIDLYTFAITTRSRALNSAQGRKSGIWENVPTKGYALFQPVQLWLGIPVAARNMHDSKLSFQRSLHNSLLRVLALYFMNMQCSCAPVFARVPTYFLRWSEHARVRGTNFRKNRGGSFRGENMESIGAVRLAA